MYLLSIAFVSIGLTGATVDPMRPQFHFLPPSNWMNDPNGPFYDEITGLFHLFYQYLTPRVWGHTISRNMVDWTILDVALNYSDAWYTEIPGETKGVYSGQATILPGGSSYQPIPWLTASVPTNDMIILATPSNLSDPYFTKWAYDPKNPVIYAEESAPTVPPGRDPSHFWPCGDNEGDSDGTFCLGYATQLSEGCPCSGVSGFNVFTVHYDRTHGNFSNWTDVGYLANDTNGALMWECTDFFPLDVADSQQNKSIWMLKFSIGPGPSYSLPWGNPSPRDYYVTGEYEPRSVTGFVPSSSSWQQAMQRDASAALDTGAFYASTSFAAPVEHNSSRILWGWLPEERNTTDTGAPFGWAGVQSLPRHVVPYQGPDGAWLVRTPVVEQVMQALREKDSQIIYADPILLSVSSSSPSATSVHYLSATSGQQLELIVNLALRADEYVQYSGAQCGVRILSSLTESNDTANISTTEFTDIVVRFGSSGSDDVSTPAAADQVTLILDPSRSCYDVDAQVNRTSSASATLNLHTSSSVQLRVIVDHSVVETFLQEGSAAMTRRVYPANASSSVQVQAIAQCQPGAPQSDSCSCWFENVTSWVLRSANITSEAVGPPPNSSGSNMANGGLPVWVTPVVVVACVVGAASLGWLGWWSYRKVVLNRRKGEALLQM